MFYAKLICNASYQVLLGPFSIYCICFMLYKLCSVTVHFVMLVV